MTLTLTFDKVFDQAFRDYHFVAENSIGRSDGIITLVKGNVIVDFHRRQIYAGVAVFQVAVYRVPMLKIQCIFSM